MPRDRSIARCVDKTIGLNDNVAELRGDIERRYPAVRQVDISQNRTQQHRDAGIPHGFVDPSRQCDLVILDDNRIARGPVLRRTIGEQIPQNVVRDSFE